MTTPLDQVKDIIEQKFPGANTDHLDFSTGIVSGSIVVSQFEGVPFTSRLQLVRDLVTEKLGSSSIDVGTIVPLAPSEETEALEIYSDDGDRGDDH